VIDEFMMLTVQFGDADMVPERSVVVFMTHFYLPFNKLSASFGAGPEYCRVVYGDNSGN
jgi:hypothetical protein